MTWKRLIDRTGSRYTQIFVVEMTSGVDVAVGHGDIDQRRLRRVQRDGSAGAATLDGSTLDQKAR